MLKGSAVSKWILGLALGYGVSQVFKPKAPVAPAPTPRPLKKIYSGPGTALKATASSYNKVSSI